MKQKLIPTLAIFVLIALLVFIISCQKSPSSPEGTVKAALDSFMKGDYDNALSYFIDKNGATRFLMSLGASSALPCSKGQ